MLFLQPQNWQTCFCEFSVPRVGFSLCRVAPRFPCGFWMRWPKSVRSNENGVVYAVPNLATVSSQKVNFFVYSLLSEERSTTVVFQVYLSGNHCELTGSSRVEKN